MEFGRFLEMRARHRAIDRTAALSTLAAIRLEYTSLFGSSDTASQYFSIWVGVRLEALPFPPAAKNPNPPSSPLIPSFTAPHTVVVTPLECQSKPKTQPKD